MVPSEAARQSCRLISLPASACSHAPCVGNVSGSELRHFGCYAKPAGQRQRLQIQAGFGGATRLARNRIGDVAMPRFLIRWRQRPERCKIAKEEVEMSSQATLAQLPV